MEFFEYFVLLEILGLKYLGYQLLLLCVDLIVVRYGLLYV